jgi:phage tail-like protein
MARVDPYFGFRFRIEIEGVTEGGFSEVSGLQVTTQVEDFREGGVNEFVYKFPKETTFDNLVLKRGMADTETFYKWHRNVALGKIERKTISVILKKSDTEDAKTWSFKQAYPIKWTGPELKADSSTIAVETLEFVHHGYAD